MNHRLWIAILLLAACDTEQGGTTKTVAFEYFTIEVPLWWHAFPRDGNDFYVGQLGTNNQGRVDFILGWYAEELVVDALTHEIIWTEIDNKKANVVSPKDFGDGTTGVYIDSLEVSKLLKFRMSAINLRPEDQALLLKAIGTLKFKEFVPPVIPSCLEQKITELKSEPPRNPPASFWEVDYGGQKAYYIPPYCCDAFSELLDINCNLICSPDGGLTGQGDGKCTSTITNRVLVWKDKR